MEKYGRSADEEHDIKKRAADFCTGGVPQPRGPLGIGDKVKMAVDGYYLVGYIFKDLGATVEIMWVEKWNKNNKLIKKRDQNNISEDKRYWGWPGRGGSSWRGKIGGKNQHNKKKLKLVKECDKR